jgi:hypothetical protein
MTTITILPETDGAKIINYRALTGEKEAVGKTAGEALDALTLQLSKEESSVLVVIRNQKSQSENKSVDDPKESLSFSLGVPRLAKLWKYLENYSRLGKLAKAHRGIHWKKVEGSISNKEKPGYVKGFAYVRNCFGQYKIGESLYLSKRKEDQYDNAYLLDWKSPKVACNAARLSRKRWRLGAIADMQGFAFSKRFLVFFPTIEISLYSLAALLNSPIANAYVHEKDGERDNRTSTLEELPIPSADFLFIGQELDLLSKEFHRLVNKNNRFKSEEKERDLKNLLLKIDAEILKAYDLPPVLERQLLDTFQGIPRPVPIKFDGYYPEGFQSYVPLHELISEERQEARADRLLERLTPIYDKKISEMLSWLNE